MKPIPLVLLFLILPFWLGNPAISAQTDRRITVTGECRIEVTPDLGSVNLIADSLNPDPKESIRKATALHEKVRDELKRSRLKNLEIATSEYSVQEQKVWENNKHVSKGYETRLGLKVTTPEIADLGEVIAIANRAGIKNIGQLLIYLSEAKTLDEKKKCLSLAAKNAREKADTLAKAMQSKVGSIQQIRESGASNPAPMPMAESFAIMAKGASAEADIGRPTIEGQKQSIAHQIEAVFSLE